MAGRGRTGPVHLGASHLHLDPLHLGASHLPWMQAGLLGAPGHESWVP